MSIDFLEHGRIQQKKRTFDALVDAARDLIASGVTPTVEDAATAASVSRTTAYRYFPNQAALLAAAHPEIETESLLGDVGDDPVARVDQVVDELSRIVVETESQQRATLRLSLEVDPSRRSELVLRQGRAIAWIREALEPAEASLGADTVHDLALAIRSAVGIEALVWLTDVAGMTRDQARDLMRWSARTMTTGALAGSPPPPRTSRRRGPVREPG